MGIGRRGFLRAMGLGAVSAPAIAKEQMSTFGMGGSTPFISSPVFNSHPKISSSAPTEEALLAFVETHGIPGYILDSIKRRHQVHNIDPDLASNKSFSLATKTRIQLERDSSRAVEDFKANLKNNITKKHLRNLTGFEFWT